MNRTYHLRVYVGPTLVAPIASQFRAAGLAVTSEGTAHVYVMFECDPTPETWVVRGEFLNTLRATLNTTFCLGLRDVEVLRQVEVTN